MSAETVDAAASTATRWEVVALVGEMDLASAPDVRARLNSYVDASPVWLVLDVADVEFVDSTGLGVLVGALRRVRGSGGDVRIAAARPAMQRVLSVTGLDQVFRLFPTVEQATAAPFDAHPADV